MPEAPDLHSFRLLAISGSLRRASTNTAVLEALADLAPDDVEVTLYRGLAASWQGIFIAAPEYAHGVPGALKNALDWLVASDAFPGKPVALVNTAPRAFHAQAALRETLATMAARLVPEAFITLPLTGRTIGASEIAADPRLAKQLREALDALVATIASQPGASALTP